MNPMCTFKCERLSGEDFNAQKYTQTDQYGALRLVSRFIQCSFTPDEVVCGFPLTRIKSTLLLSEMGH